MNRTVNVVVTSKRCGKLAWKYPKTRQRKMTKRMSDWTARLYFHVFLLLYIGRLCSRIQFIAHICKIVRCVIIATAISVGSSAVAEMLLTYQVKKLHVGWASIEICYLVALCVCNWTD